MNIMLNDKYSQHRYIIVYVYRLFIAIVRCMKDGGLASCAVLKGGKRLGDW